MVTNCSTLNWPARYDYYVVYHLGGGGPPLGLGVRYSPKYTLLFALFAYFVTMLVEGVDRVRLLR